LSHSTCSSVLGQAAAFLRYLKEILLAGGGRRRSPGRWPPPGQRTRWCPVAEVIVGGPLGQAGPQRQEGLGPVRGLNLGFLIDADHNRGLGWVEVKAHDVGELGFQLRIGAELEALPPSRLKVLLLPDLDDAGGEDLQFAGQRPGRPVGHSQPRRRRDERGDHDGCLIDRLWPLGGGLSSSGLMPPAAYRDHQWRTVGTNVPHCSVTSVCGRLWAAHSTIFAHRARPASPACKEAILASFSQVPFRSTSGTDTCMPRLSQKERDFLVATIVWPSQAKVGLCAPIVVNAPAIAHDRPESFRRICCGLSEIGHHTDGYAARHMSDSRPPRRIRRILL
jgi:hypothetical protein